MSILCAKNKVIALLLFMILSTLTPMDGFCGSAAPPKKGETVPDMTLPSPVMKKEIAYLGIGGKNKFSIQDLDAELIVLEILGVYCPLCHKQRPHINRLFHRVNKSSDLSDKIKFLGIATGATAMEVAFYVKQSKVPYPIVLDDKYALHKILGEPRTPYTMVVNKKGEVLFTNLGIIKDMNKFFATLKDLLR